MLRSILASSRRACPACHMLPRFLSSTALAVADPTATLSAASESSQAVSAIFTSPKYNPVKQYRSDGYERPVTLSHERKRLAIKEARRATKKKRKTSLQDPMETMHLSKSRMCIASREYLPSYFMIILRAAVIPPTEDDPARLLLLPDQLADPTTKRRKGIGMWVTCHHKMVATLSGMKGAHRVVLQFFPDIRVPPNLPAIVHAQLLTRVLHEARVLNRKVQSRGGTAGNPLRWVPRPKVEGERNVENLSDSVADLPESDIVAYFDFDGIPHVTPGPELLGDSPFPMPSFLPPIPNASPVPFVPTRIGRLTRIPLYPLASLFPPDMHAHLRALLTEHVPPSRGFEDEIGGEEVLALSGSPRRQGAMGTALAVALWRLMCFSGQEWSVVPKRASSRSQGKSLVERIFNVVYE